MCTCAVTALDGKWILQDYIYQMWKLGQMWYTPKRLKLETL